MTRLILRSPFGTRVGARLLAALLLAATLATPRHDTLRAQGHDAAQQQARPHADWVRDAVIYELYPRQFSQAGTFNAVCIATSGGVRGRLSCTGTYALAGGTLMGQALLVGEDAVQIAIVGGTGAYAGARGYVTSVERRNGNLDTIHLLR